MMQVVKMNRIHKSFTVMAQGGMFEYIGDEEVSTYTAKYLEVK